MNKRTFGTLNYNLDKFYTWIWDDNLRKETCANQNEWDWIYILISWQSPWCALSEHVTYTRHASPFKLWCHRGNLSNVTQPHYGVDRCLVTLTRERNMNVTAPVCLFFWGPEAAVHLQICVFLCVYVCLSVCVANGASSFDGSSLGIGQQKQSPWQPTCRT